MRHGLPFSPQFYVTAPQTCPYLEGRTERKLFTALHGDNAQTLNDALSLQGFRRSQSVLYRPTCAECSLCMSARIRVADFTPSRSQRRVSARNENLRRRLKAPWASEEQYALFRRYLDHRHPDGGMADMDMFEFASMIEETPVRTRVVEYFDPADRGGETLGLRAASLTDVLADGLSMVYSFFDVGLSQNSLGTFMVLDHIAMAREMGLPYVYLGYWVPGSPKMAYKARFSALEVYRSGGWVAMDDPARYATTPDPLATDPIAQQVARIALPDAGQGAKISASQGADRA